MFYIYKVHVKYISKFHKFFLYKWMNPTENIFDSYWLEYFSNSMYQHMFLQGK